MHPRRNGLGRTQIYAKKCPQNAARALKKTTDAVVQIIEQFDARRFSRRSLSQGFSIALCLSVSCTAIIIIVLMWRTLSFSRKWRERELSRLINRGERR